MNGLPEIVLAHQLGGDPFGIHELFVLAATAGAGALMAVKIYARRLMRLIRLAWLRTRRFVRKFYQDADKLPRHHH